jgi:hypothetical protein
MANMAKSLILILIIVAILTVAGCSGTPSPANQPVSEPLSQPGGRQPSPPLFQQNTSASSQPVTQPAQQTASTQNAAPVPPPVKTPAPAPPVLSSRVDVIYFHMDTQCASCNCFEKQVSGLIDKYFQVDIQSGKLTFRVLNAQDPRNAAIAKRYGAVGSQLFINDVVNEYDNIENVEEIWDWDCLNNPSGFDLNVKGLIERYLSVKR